MEQNSSEFESDLENLDQIVYVKNKDDNKYKLEEKAGHNGSGNKNGHNYDEEFESDEATNDQCDNDCDEFEELEDMDDNDDPDSIFGDDCDDDDTDFDPMEDNEIIENEISDNLLSESKKKVLQLQTINVKAFKSLPTNQPSSAALPVTLKLEKDAQFDTEYFPDKFEESDEDYVYPGKVGKSKKKIKPKKKKKAVRSVLKKTAGLINVNGNTVTKSNFSFAKPGNFNYRPVLLESPDPVKLKRDVAIQCRVPQTDPIKADLIHEFQLMNDIFR